MPLLSLLFVVNHVSYLFDGFFFLFLQGKKITNDCVEMVNTITEEELCANPTIINTPYINLTACIEKATEMKVSKLLKGESGVKLPDAKDLFPGDLLDDNTIVDVKVCVNKPFLERIINRSTEGLSRLLID